MRIKVVYGFLSLHRVQDAIGPEVMIKGSSITNIEFCDLEMPHYTVVTSDGQRNFVKETPPEILDGIAESYSQAKQRMF